MRFHGGRSVATQLTESCAKTSVQTNMSQTVTNMSQTDRSQADSKLGEVRAVLQRLQTFSAEPNNSPLASEGGAPESTVSEPAAAARRRAPATTGLTIAGTAFLVLGLIWLTVSPTDHAYLPAAATPDVTVGNRAISEGDAAAGQPVLRSSVPRADMDVAQELLTKGQVQAARKQLLGMSSAGDADVAWMLARSYDPNFLATLPRADAAPDIEQATQWYRTWHAAAVMQGMVPNSVSVERIIGSMR
jgi:hypothetical protein